MWKIVENRVKEIFTAIKGNALDTAEQQKKEKLLIPLQVWWLVIHLKI